MVVSRIPISFSAGMAKSFLSCVTIFLRKYKQFRVELVVPTVLSRRMLGLKTVTSNLRAAVRMWPAEVTPGVRECIRIRITYAPQPERRKNFSDLVTFTHIVKSGKHYLSCNRIRVYCMDKYCMDKYCMDKYCMDKYFMLEISRCEKCQKKKKKQAPPHSLLFYL
jgi:hypothetical protein